MLLPASDKLLKASAVTEIADGIIPTLNLVAKRKRLRIIPTVPVRIPYLRRTFSSLKSFLFFIKIEDKSAIILKFPENAAIRIYCIVKNIHTIIIV